MKKTTRNGNANHVRSLARVLAVLLVIVMITGSLSGCSMLPFLQRDQSQGNQSDNSKKDENSKDRSGKKQTVTDEEYTVNIDGEKYTGSYTGEVENDVPSGEGEFTADDDFTFTGTFDKGKPIDGELEDFPMTLYVHGQDMEGVYDGPLAKKELTGEGTFTSGDFVYKGSFEYGVFKGSATVTNMPFTMEKFNRTLEGIYNGPVEDLLPDGEGSFAFEESTYTGTFKEGSFENGTMKDLYLSIHIGREGLDGTYNGPVADGFLSGEGTFSTESMTYTGTFAEDLPTGDGMVTGFIFELWFQDYAFVGTYEGSVKSFKPDGNGKFDLPKQGDNVYLTYEGTFDEGFLYDGTIDTNHCTITFINSDQTTTARLGTYTGGIGSGLPAGDGVFYAINSNNQPYELVGNFDEGRPNGTLTQTYHLAEGDLIWQRDYQNGQSIYHSAADYFARRIVNYGPATQSDYNEKPPLKAYEFVRKYESELDGLTESETLKKLVNPEITHDKVYDDIFLFAGEVGKFENYYIYNIGTPTQVNGDLYVLYFTTISNANSNNVIWVAIFGTENYLNSLSYKENDVITIWGAPIYIAERDDAYHYIYVLTFEIDK